MKCHWLMNHECTVAQRTELETRFGVDELVLPGEGLSAFWSDIPCTADYHLDLVNAWLATVDSGDVAVVQGDATYSFYVVSALMAKGVRTFASVTERVVKEEKAGETVRICRVFSHKLFREYHMPGLQKEER